MHLKAEPNKIHTAKTKIYETAKGNKLIQV